MSEWINFSVEKPATAGVYEWRVPSAALPGEFVIVAAHMRKRGAGYQDVLSPSFDHWDGYHVYVTKDLKWRPTTEYGAIKSYERRVIGLEGLEHCKCIYCAKRPTLHAVQVPNGGGVVVCAEPQYLNSWWLECCTWGKTPHFANPRDIESMRRRAIARAKAMP